MNGLKRADTIINETKKFIKYDILFASLSVVKTEKEFLSTLQMLARTKSKY